MAVLLRAHSGRQAVADFADIGLDATGYRQQVAVLGNESSDQVLERGSFPVAHNRHDEADQCSKQLKRLPRLLQDGGEGLSDAVLVIAGSASVASFPVILASMRVPEASGAGLRTAIRLELPSGNCFVESIREAFGSPDQKHQRCIGAYGQP